MSEGVLVEGLREKVIIGTRDQQQLSDLDDQEERFVGVEAFGMFIQVAECLLLFITLHAADQRFADQTQGEFA